MGKTRLALAVAERVRADGAAAVVWLSGHGAPGADRPGHPEHSDRAGQPHDVLRPWILDRLSGAGPVDDLAALIGDRRTLLVVDAHESSRVLREPLLRLLDHCPGLRVLTTTREPLLLRDARTVPVRPLSLTAVGGSGSGDEHPPAVALLLSRLRYCRPVLEPTEATVEAAALLCGVLDGIPLALELAAAWFPVYSPQQLVPIARESPLDLLEPVFGAEGEAGTDLRGSVRQSVAGLRPSESRLLRALALHTGALPSTWRPNASAWRPPRPGGPPTCWCCAGSPRRSAPPTAAPP
ncbi:hypothetical protein ACFQ2M_19205 [Kitasatospora saccharophila]|uniref:hypothetical protein n=1 Tax=Kitasatospora saccharophila TaxID=407973 RepID=UPI00362ACC70